MKPNTLIQIYSWLLSLAITIPLSIVLFKYIPMLVNILNGLNLGQIGSLISGILFLVALFYTAVWLAQKEKESPQITADRAVEYRKKKVSEVEQTKVNNQDQNKRLGI